ncbi:MAG: polysaccharide biosynthesis C-terminal domain-containing protein, partial [Bacteroidales bacterium]|nr:polysaccharide biosynthesis C-terminal domain-containing protein [Bacteroidales bacterium]
MASPSELATKNVKKLMLEYSAPAIAAMLTSSLYNIIDSIFIGQGVGALAIAGLAITMPIMNLSAAFGAMVGVGGGTLTSIRMGQQDIESATRVLSNVIIMNILFGVLFSIFGIIYIDDLLYLFGASDQTISYARDFMFIILLGNPITHLYLGLNDVIRSSGYPQKSMYITISTVIINIILAPIFIFLFDWGIRGAALATVISQTVAFIVELFHFAS